LDYDRPSRKGNRGTSGRKEVGGTTLEKKVRKYMFPRGDRRKGGAFGARSRQAQISPNKQEKGSIRRGSIFQEGKKNSGLEPKKGVGGDPEGKCLKRKRCAEL